MYRNPNSWGKQANVEGIPKRCSNSRITVEVLVTSQICILHFDKKAHSKLRETRRGGVSYAGVALFARLSKDHSVRCRKQPYQEKLIKFKDNALERSEMSKVACGVLINR